MTNLILITDLGRQESILSGEIEAKEANGESKVGCGKNNRISETINVLPSTQEAPRAVREQVPLPGYMNHG